MKASNIPTHQTKIYLNLIKAYENGNYSNTAAALEKRRGKLNVFEKALLARINWAMYYPYIQTMALKACNLMGEALKAMPIGPDRDGLLIEYADMLNKISRRRRCHKTYQ